MGFQDETSYHFEFRPKIKTSVLLRIGGQYDVMLVFRLIQSNSHVAVKPINNF